MHDDPSPALGAGGGEAAFVDSWRRIRRWLREPAVVGAVLIVLAIVTFVIGRLSSSGTRFLSDPDVALDTVHQGGQLVALNSSDGGGYGPEGGTWERVARFLAVLAFAAFGFEVLRAISAPAVERLRLCWRRVAPWLGRRPRIAVLGSDVRADWLSRQIASPAGTAGREPSMVTLVRDAPPVETPALGPLLVAVEPSVTTSSLRSLDIDRADQVIVMAADDAVALAHLDAVLSLPDRRPAGAPARVVRVELRTPEVREQVRAADWDGSPAGPADGGRWDVRVWSSDELAARHALRRTRLDWRAPCSMSGSRSELIAIGFGDAGRVLASAILRRAHHVDETRLRITVIDVEASRCIARMRASFPLIDQVVEFEAMPLDGFDPAVRQVVLDRLRAPFANPLLSVAVGDVDGNLAIALGIGREVARLGPTLGSGGTAAGMPVFVRQAGLSDVQGVFGRLRAAGARGALDLRPWGGLDEACRPEDILEGRMDRRAMRIHESYLAGNPPRPEDSSDPYSARRPWRDLWSFLRDDNRNRADFLDARLRSVGLVIGPVGSPGTMLVPGQLTPGEREALARLEHRRWTVSRVLAGWTRGTPRDNAARRHPSICPWGELDGAERAKDDVMLDLGHAMFAEERLYRA